MKPDDVLPILLRDYSLAPEGILGFKELYLPLVKACLSLEELVFERFDEIERAVLALIYYGITANETLAALLSLSVKMIETVRFVLECDGAVTGSRVTSLGLQRLRAESILRTVTIQEHIYISPLTLSVFSKNACPRKMLRFPPHEESVLLDTPPQIPTAFIKEHILSSPETFLKKNRDILGLNIKEINDLTFTTRLYFPCFLLMYRSLMSPVVFYEPKTRPGAFLYLPLSVGSEEDRKILSPNRKIPKHNADFTEFLKRVGKKFYERI